MDVSRAAVEASRLLPLARSALRRYHYDVRSVSHLATHSNILYRVETTSGEQLVLRVGSVHGNTRTNIDYEVAWLAALAVQALWAVVMLGLGRLVLSAALRKLVVQGG